MSRLLPLREEPMEKQIIIADRYRVIRKIGEGGMAKVYLAYDSKLDFNVALKILKKENVDDKKVRNFKREAQALSLMDDDNIVKIFDVGEEGNIHYIATEFVDGMTLKEFIVTCSPIPVDEVVDLALQVLRGVAHAHNNNVVHKDIKSLNILLDVNRNVKITDFGIANIMDEDSTKTQSLMGTPQYVAPEILNREILTEQSDIYSVGILMYEMLIGKAPFTGEKPAVIIIKQMNHPLPSIIDERSNVPQSLENIIIRATAKRLENRYKTAQDAIDDLNNVFIQARNFEEKLILENDIIDEDKLDKTILLNKEYNIRELRNESTKIKKNKRRRNILFVTAILLILVLTALVSLNSAPPLIMPDIVNQKQEDGESSLELLGVDTSNIAIIPAVDSEVIEGNIISTQPKSGEALSTEQTIILTISEGAEKVIMKDLTSLLESDVTVEYEKLGYTVIVTYVDDSAPYGTITSQTPKAGTLITTETPVEITVSTGVYSIKMQNFTNLTIEFVEDWASDYGITVNKEYACNDTFEKGKIYNQSPNVDESVENNSEVSVSISEGACSAPTETTDTQESEAPSV